MSYDLAVWEGAHPTLDAEASLVYGLLTERMGSGDLEEPSQAIRAYVEALVQR